MTEQKNNIIRAKGDINQLAYEKSFTGENIMYDGLPHLAFDTESTATLEEVLNGDSAWTGNRTGVPGGDFSTVAGKFYRAYFPVGLPADTTKSIQFAKRIRYHGEKYGESVFVRGGDLLRLTSGDTITFSGFCRTSQPVILQAQFFCNFSDGRESINSRYEEQLMTDSEWIHFNSSVTLVDTWEQLKTDTGVNNMGFNFTIIINNDLYDNSKEVVTELKKLKLEYGDKATDFSLSNNDVTYLAKKFLINEGTEDVL